VGVSFSPTSAPRYKQNNKWRRSTERSHKPKKTLTTKLRRRGKVVDQPRNITRGLVYICPLLCLAKSIPEPLTSFLTHGMLWFLIILAQNESHEAKKNYVRCVLDFSHSSITQNRNQLWVFSQNFPRFSFSGNELQNKI
jgi:hypothetical protein